MDVSRETSILEFSWKVVAMVIVETRELSGKKGPRLLVDLRNNMVFQWTNEGEWEKVPMKTGLNALQPGHPFDAKDRFGVLEDLIIVHCTQSYRGPHPDGKVTCNCGAMMDEDGFCPRCHDEKCQRCGKPLTKGMCQDPTHNPLQVPVGRKTPIPGEDIPKAKPRPWPEKYLDLTPYHRRIINQFYSSLMGIDRLDMANWKDECAIQRLPKWLSDHFDFIKNQQKKTGPLPER